MEALYTELTDYLQKAGRELVATQADAKDIGVTKAYVTEQDIKIERALTRIILAAHPDHQIFAEEEHASFVTAKNIWVIDPLSASRGYIEGRPHYGSSLAYIQDGVMQFAAVNDPSTQELFTAYVGGGAFVNGRPMQVSSSVKTLLNNTAKSLFDSPQAVKLREATADFNPVRNEASFAVNYCWVADGRFDGVISVAKDSFPEFAGALILCEAGGKLSNIHGGLVQPEDRLFIGGNPAMHAELQRRADVALAA
jgi:myo-inositol-1(or 4)-monophosphatase